MDGTRVEKLWRIQDVVVSLQEPKHCRSMALGYEGVLWAEHLFQWSSLLDR